MNSTLGSVVPLAMFISFTPCPVSSGSLLRRLQPGAYCQTIALFSQSIFTWDIVGALAIGQVNLIVLVGEVEISLRQVEEVVELVVGKSCILLDACTNGESLVKNAILLGATVSEMILDCRCLTSNRFDHLLRVLNVYKRAMAFSGRNFP